MLARTVEALRARDPMQAAADYVETFDLRRRSTMYLTYWTAGDTRNRGREMHAFAQAYRDAGSRPPVDEAPDHLPVVLEFATGAAAGAGRPARGSGWPATVHADGAAPTYRRRPVT